MALLKKEQQPIIYDTRPKLEFENKADSGQYYRNLGHIKDAINIEESNFDSYSFPNDKTLPVLIYGRAESYKLAKKLSDKGYKNIFLLRSFYDFVSSAFNVEGSKDALKYLVNHEGLY